MQVNIDYPVLYEGDENYFFISYSHKSIADVYKVLRELNKLGIRFWYDKGLEKGKDWEEYVKTKMDGACEVLFFFDINFFTSSSLLKEVSYVKECNYSYCPIFYDGKIYQQIYRKLPDDYILDAKDEKLLFDVFNNSITAIIKVDDKQFYNEFKEESFKKGTISEKDKKHIELNTKRIAFLGKNSIFTNAIIEGIQDVYLNTQHKLTKHLVISDSDIPIDYQFQNELRSIIEIDYDAVIIRLIGKLNDKSFELFKKLCEQTNVILCDVDITQEQRDILGSKAPSFVCSDFKLGGKLLAILMKQITVANNSLFTDIVVCTGPSKNIPAMIRSSAIVEYLKNYQINASYIQLNSLDPKESLNKIKAYFNDNRKSYICDKTLIIYAANDNVALTLGKNLDNIKMGNISLLDYKSVIIMGYDGITTISHNSVLEETNCLYATIDTLPQSQGKTAAESILKQIEGQTINKLITVTPKIIKKININPLVCNKLKNAEKLLDKSNTFIFDLDGTIADTEKLHFEAYNVLMQKYYGITLRDEDIKKYIGNPEVKIYKMIENDYNVVIDVDKFLKERIDIYLNLVSERDLRPNDFVYDFIKYINGRNAKIMLLTSQIPNVVDYLFNYWNLNSFIPKENRISVHDGKKTKRQVFEEIYNSVDVNSPEVVIFEDSEAVANTASEFNFNVIGVKHSFNKDKLKTCTAIIDENSQSGLFVGLSGLDLVYYVDKLPEEDAKVKTTNYEIKVGGPALKAAMTCSKLGGYTTLITCLGNSDIAKTVKHVCDKYNIRLIDIMPNKNISNISCVAVNKNKATRTIISGQTTGDSPYIIPDYIFSQFDFCLYDCNLEFYTKELVENLDDNDIPLVLDCGSWKQNIIYAINYAKCAISSQNFKSPDGDDIFALANKYQIELTAKTKGSNPIEYLADDQKGYIDVISQKNSNTLGAGDVFHGAFCYYYFTLKLDFKEALKSASIIATDYVSGKFILD